MSTDISATVEKLQERGDYIAGTSIESYTEGGGPGWERRVGSRVVKTATCWNRIGAQGSSGYGQMRIGGRVRLVHRLSWLMVRGGSIPLGMHLDHLCRNTLCVNPDHLEIVTSRENTMRGTNHVVQNAVATECPQGHAYDDANTYLHRGKRYCRECVRRRNRAYQAARRAAA